MIVLFNARARASALLLAIAEFGCQSSPTEVIVELRPDPEVQTRASALTVRVWDTEGQLVLDRTLEKPLPWPARIPLAPRGDDADRRFRLTADVADDSCRFVRAEVSGGYRDGEQVVLPVRIEDACIDVRCPSGARCEGGVCIGGCSGANCDLTLPPAPCDPADATCGEPQVFVDSEIGSDDQDGCLNPQTPCRTPQFAIEQYVAARRARVLNLRGGRSFEPFVIDERSSGSSDRRTVVRAWPGSGTPIVAGPAAEDVVCVCGSIPQRQPSFITIDGLEITGGLSGGISLKSANDVIVQNSTVRQSVTAHEFGAGIWVTGGSRIRLANNHVFSVGVISGAGIRLNGGDAVVVIGNRIHDIVGNGIFVNLEATATIEKNRVQGCTENALWLGGGETELFNNHVCAVGGSQAVRIYGAPSSIRASHNAFVGGNYVISLDGSAELTLEDSIVALGVGAGVDVISGVLTAQKSAFFQNGSSGSGHIQGGPAPSADNLVDVDPIFHDLPGCDVYAALCSPLIGAGTAGGDIGPDPLPE